MTNIAGFQRYPSFAVICTVHQSKTTGKCVYVHFKIVAIDMKKYIFLDTDFQTVSNEHNEIRK